MKAHSKASADLRASLADGALQAETAADRVAEQPALLPELLAGLRDSRARVRFGSAKALLLLQLLPLLRDRKPVLAMVRRQMANSRRATANKAAAFLKKHRSASRARCLAALWLGSSLVGGLGLAGAPGETNWPQLRGLGGLGVATDPRLPDRWSAAENVAWKCQVPGRGWSSPVVWGNRVFLTTAVSASEIEPAKKGLYLGGDRADPPQSRQQWKVLCLDLATGKTRWERMVSQGPPPGPVHIKNSFASETPVTDGERVYACFGNVGIFCLDAEGRPVWSRPLPARKMRNGWGTAASPVVHRERLYYVSDNDEQSYLLALDKRTGQEVWRVLREEKSNWSTPCVWESGPRVEVVTAGTGLVRSYSLEGKLLWWLRGMSSITIGTPYAEGGLLYVSSGFVGDKSRPLYAIRPEAAGDISLAPGQTNSPAIAWCQPTAAPYNPTTLVYEGRLYVLHDRGLVSAYNAQSGALLFDRERLPQGLHFTASPWACGGRIFCLNEDGVTFVLRSGDRFELLHTNKLAEDDMCLATPALAGDCLLIRSAARLYCIRGKAAAN